MVVIHTLRPEALQAVRYDPYAGEGEQQEALLVDCTSAVGLGDPNKRQ